jgi:hypothetical protein
MNKEAYCYQPIWCSRSGSASSRTRAQQDTPIGERVVQEVTITDPRHPLFGQTLPVRVVQTYHRPTHITVLLPNGRQRSVPRHATNLASDPKAELSRQDLPPISVRTILPLARFVSALKQAKEECDAPPRQPINHSSKSTSRLPNALAATDSRHPTAGRQGSRRPDPANSPGGTGGGSQP